MSFIWMTLMKTSAKRWNARREPPAGSGRRGQRENQSNYLPDSYLIEQGLARPWKYWP